MTPWGDNAVRPITAPHKEKSAASPDVRGPSVALHLIRHQARIARNPRSSAFFQPSAQAAALESAQRPATHESPRRPAHEAAGHPKTHKTAPPMAHNASRVLTGEAAAPAKTPGSRTPAAHQAARPQTHEGLRGRDHKAPRPQTHEGLRGESRERGLRASRIFSLSNFAPALAQAPSSNTQPVPASGDARPPAESAGHLQHEAERALCQPRCQTPCRPLLAQECPVTSPQASTEIPVRWCATEGDFARADGDPQARCRVANPARTLDLYMSATSMPQQARAPAIDIVETKKIASSEITTPAGAQAALPRHLFEIVGDGYFCLENKQVKKLKMLLQSAALMDSAKVTAVAMKDCLQRVRFTCPADALETVLHALSVPPDMLINYKELLDMLDAYTPIYPPTSASTQGVEAQAASAVRPALHVVDGAARQATMPLGTVQGGGRDHAEISEGSKRGHHTKWKSSVRVLFRMQNDVQCAPGLEEGRCFGVVCEWARKVIMGQSITKMSQLDEDAMNRGQALYEKAAGRSEEDIITAAFGIAISRVEHVEYTLASKPHTCGVQAVASAARVVCERVMAQPHGTVIVGLFAMEGSEAPYCNHVQGHALSFHTNGDSFELLDPEFGLFSGSDREVFFQHMVAHLVRRQRHLLPQPPLRTGAKYLLRLFHLRSSRNTANEESSIQQAYKFIPGGSSSQVWQ
ncbi:hypothetical protein CYMTET_10474 [Cymbomonas tetramitiformis]|uniref:Peptidase C58 YopT-type domain-containing protein n=1 Tax=Cymbomonas tetramitiformis TaxID=36881 RepID=A0AAE0LEF4_9CHLO|nr:hypothetical protein CYMTET_10474 [Cymbomonas tetramitiformis]